LANPGGGGGRKKGENLVGGGGGGGGGEEKNEEYLDCGGRMMCENCSTMEPAVFGVLEGDRKAELPPD